MKKRIALILIVVFALALGACSGYSRPPVSGEKQRTDYVVLSNGGSVVQYGNYVYFINGYRGYEDANGDENNWGDVEKGGLYRAELNGNSSSRTKQDFLFYYSPDQPVSLNVFNSVRDTNGMEFKYTEDNPIFAGYEPMVDEDDEDEEKVKKINYENTINVQQIVPKTIGTSGYDDGGIFIYDDYIYYASPSNNYDKNGNVEQYKTEFYRTTLDGSSTIKLYTTDKDSSTSDYTFYKQNGSVYLVVLDGTNLVSVKVGSKKAEKAKKIAENVSSCYLPTKSTYYNYTEGGTTYKSYENGVEDFVYYIRPATSDDKVSGNVIEVMRPNGEERFIIHNDRGAMNLLGSENGVLFYQVPDVSYSTKLVYTNLHDVLSDKSTSYKNALTNNEIKVGTIKGELYGDISGYTEVKGIFPNAGNIGSESGTVSDVYFIAFGDNIKMFSIHGESVLYNGSASYAGFADGYLYFLAENTIFRINLFDGIRQPELVADDGSGVGTYKVDFTTDFIYYFGNYTDLADNYLRIKPIANVSSESMLIGHIIDDEMLQEDED